VPAPDRFVNQPTAEALQRREGALRQTRRQYGPVVRVTFATADAPREVRHLLDALPTGYDVSWQTGAVYAARLADWTADIVWLTAPAANTEARVQFYVDVERDEIV
jgi:hypothetical protein